MMFLAVTPKSHLTVCEPQQGKVTSERQMVQCWQSVKAGEQFNAVDDTILYVLELGSVNIYDGPDISKAKLLVDSEVHNGGVEFHLNERDWFSHGHDRDPLYNNVILHVVGRAGNRRATTLSGQRVLTVICSDVYTDCTWESGCKLTCDLDGELIRLVTQPFMWIRWLEKVHRFYDDLVKGVIPRDLFYLKSFGALGLKGNVHLFEKLARSLPLTLFSKMKSTADIKATLFGSAGFLSDLENEKESLLSAWDCICRKYQVAQVVESYEWNHRSVRPAADPFRRLRFGVDLVTELLSGWQPWKDHDSYTYQNLVTLFSETIPGRGWISEWLGNVVYPMQEAICMVEGKLKNRGNEIFEQWYDLKLGYTYGRLSRQFNRKIPTKELNSFSVQQGLMALQNRYCRQGLCAVCPLVS
ncbi:MAG: DUF2851 family protein [Candidatus Marinimicrobia bacterium]|nr:DUF2851 family protein [Candidatus Neomarinimicrobiota bacterium]